MSNWESVDNRSGVDRAMGSTALKVGDSIEGKVTSIVKTYRFADTSLPIEKQKHAYDVIIETDDETLLLFTTGNLTYKIDDNKIQVGNTYKITRVEDTPAKKKGNKPRSNFDVQVDRDALVKLLPAI